MKNPIPSSSAVLAFVSCKAMVKNGNKNHLPKTNNLSFPSLCHNADNRVKQIAANVSTGSLQNPFIMLCFNKLGVVVP